MGRQADGTFTRVDGAGRSGEGLWELNRSAGVNIDAGPHDAHDQDLADGLTDSVSRSGKGSPSADLPMGGHKHTGVGAADARDQYATKGQLDDATSQTVPSANVGGTANAITLTPVTAVPSLSVGLALRFIVKTTNTGPVTVQIGGLEAVPLTKRGAVPLDAGDLPAGGMTAIQYDGTRFQLPDILPHEQGFDLEDDVTLTKSAPVLADKVLIGDTQRSGTPNAETTVLGIVRALFGTDIDGVRFAASESAALAASRTNTKIVYLAPRS